MSKERDELAREIFIADNSAQSREESTKDWAAYNMATDQTYAHNIADGLLAAGYTKPRTITDADIERAAQSHYELDPMCLMLDPEPIPWKRLGGGWKAPHYSAVKAILSAIEPSA